MAGGGRTLKSDSILGRTSRIQILQVVAGQPQRQFAWIISRTKHENERTSALPCKFLEGPERSARRWPRAARGKEWMGRTRISTPKASLSELILTRGVFPLTHAATERGVSAVALAEQRLPLARTEC